MFSTDSIWSALLVESLLVVCLLAPGSNVAPPAGDSSVQDETAAPGPQHERMMTLAGTYSTITTMTAGDGTGGGSTGQATFSSILGGRFLLQEEKGTMFGHPFEARKMYGFNTATKKYEGLWIYTGATAMMTMTGTSTDEGKTITYGASYEGPGGTPSKLDIVITELGADKFSIVLKSKPSDGSKPSVMETTYTRKK